MLIGCRTTCLAIGSPRAPMVAAMRPKRRGAFVSAHFAGGAGGLDSGYFEGNLRSARVLQKLGLSKTGRDRRFCKALGVERPHVIMHLTPELRLGAAPRATAFSRRQGGRCAAHRSDETFPDWTRRPILQTRLRVQGMIDVPASAVPFDDCDYSLSQELLYHGAPYTGAVVEYGPAGQVVSLQWFRDGILDGRSCIWTHAGSCAKRPSLPLVCANACAGGTRTGS